LSKHNYWQYLFAPNSVAVIGASDTPGTWGCGITRQLLESANRDVYLVNPTVSEVLGIATYHSVVNIPSLIDLAIIAVTASQVPAVLREYVQKDVRTAVIISAGFGDWLQQIY